MKITDDPKQSLNLSFPVWFKENLLSLSKKQGVSISQLIRETMLEKYPVLRTEGSKIFQKLLEK